MFTIAWIFLILVASFALAYHQSSKMLWTGVVGGLLLLYLPFAHLNVVGNSLVLILLILYATVMNANILRRMFLTRFIFNRYKKLQPTLSDTEKEAIAAGTVDWDRDLVKGEPDWKKLLNYPKPELTQEEQQFLDGPASELCALLEPWKINHELMDLPPEIWDFLKTKGFFAFIISKEYGGLDFSAYAIHRVISMISSISVVAGATIAVPNSLGPAELLHKYGTKEQKDYYLPRLAKGLEVPCFALTSPEAGSDASAMPDKGIVCMGEINGEKVLGMRVTWNKRYITLAPIATVLGLAFRAYDPDGLLGDKVALGVTCALIPVTTPGVIIGRRHLPNRTPFQNGPTQGTEVFIPMDYIIGGQERIGQGWGMLMECLAAGRGVSVPSMILGSLKSSIIATNAYSMIRKQFKLQIGKFEGVREAMAVAAGILYITDSSEKLVTSFLAKGQNPAVISAIVKLCVTELGRIALLNCMDIHGGKAIFMGPKNYLTQFYLSMPIGITVEGANILTRSLIIFGQGAIRCHPFTQAEMEACWMSDEKEGLKQFDKAFFEHLNHIMRNAAFSFWNAITFCKFMKVPASPLKQYLKKFHRFSAVMAVLTDILMFYLGAEFKKKESISSRLADMLCTLYMASAVIKRYHDSDYDPEEYPLVEWSCNYLLYKIEQQVLVTLDNFPNRFIALILKIMIFPFGRGEHKPLDNLDAKVATVLLTPCAARDRLFEGAYLNPTDNNLVGNMQVLLEKILAAQPVENKILSAIDHDIIANGTYEVALQNALMAKIITEAEAKKLQEIQDAIRKVVSVDDFSLEELA